MDSNGYLSALEPCITEEKSPLSKYEPILFGDACFVSQIQGLGKIGKAYEENKIEQFGRAVLRLQKSVMEIALKGTPSNLQIHQQEDGHDMKNKENSHISGKRISKETGKDKLQVGERIDIVEETSEECEEFQEKKSSKDKTVLNSVQIINNFLDTLFIILKK